MTGIKCKAPGCGMLVSAAQVKRWQRHVKRGYTRGSGPFCSQECATYVLSTQRRKRAQAEGREKKQ